MSMKKLLPALFLLLFFLGLFLILAKLGLLNKSPARLQLETSPSARIYLNGEDLGVTPLTKTDLKAGPYTLKLVPEPSGASLAPYETSVDLLAGDSVVINHVFAQAQSDSYGYTLELKKDPSGGTFFSLVTDPDKANLTLDGSPKGYAPISKLEVTPGEHSLSLTSPGYKPQSFSVNTLEGYNLIVKAKLGAELITLTPAPSASPSADLLASPSPSPLAPAGPHVIVEETGTGWLRVRSEPSSSAQELGKANVGDTLPYLGDTTETGWLKVEWEGAPAWVSSRYVTLVE